MFMCQKEQHKNSRVIGSIESTSWKTKNNDKKLLLFSIVHMISLYESYKLIKYGRMTSFQMLLFGTILYIRYEFYVCRKIILATF